MDKTLITRQNIENEINDVKDSYLKLESLGHIEQGSVSDNVNWDEIKSVAVKWPLHILEKLQREVEKNKDDYLGDDGRPPYDSHGYSHATRDILTLISTYIERLKK